MKEQCSAALTKWQVALFVNNDLIYMHKSKGRLTLLIRRFFKLQSIDQFHG